jgi:hypothetical protein
MPPEFYRERQPTPADWVEAVFEPGALIVLIGCFAAGLVAFFQSWAPPWDSRFAVPLSLLVAAEGFFYTRRFTRPALLPKEILALLVPVALVLRLLMLIPESADVPIVSVDPTDLGSVFTLGYVANLVVLLIAWSMSTDATNKLNSVRLRRGEMPAAARSAQRDDLYDNSWRLVDHATPLRELADRLLWGGFVLVLLAGLTAINEREAFSLDVVLRLVTFGRATLGLTLSNVLVYFVVSLLLLSEAQLARHRTSWQLSGLSQPPGLARRWVVQAVAVAVGLLLVALVLPVDLVSAVTLLIAAVATVASWITMAMVVGIYFIVTALSWPFRLLNLSSIGGATEPPGRPPPVDGAPPQTPEWLLLAQTALTWLAILAIVVFALRTLWLHRAVLPRVGIIGALMTLLGALVSVLLRLVTAGRGAAAWVLAALPVRRAVEVVARVRPRLGLHLSRLGPRELIEYYYLSTAQRAAKLGLPRQRGETAREYSARLPKHVPELDPALSTLTDSFDTARYGPIPVGNPEVARARVSWAAVKARLQRRRQIR